MQFSKITLVVLFLCAVIGHAGAQSVDTLGTAKELAYAKQYQPALDLLIVYTTNHPGNMEALRFYIKVYYWNKQVPFAKAKYVEAISLHPEEPKLKLDYGKMLFELNELNHAQKILTEFTAMDTINLDAKYILGIIHYWRGRSNLAKSYLKDVLGHDPLNQNAAAILVQIETAQAPYLNVSTGYYNDNQPIHKVPSTVEFGFYTSRYLAPKINIQSQQIENQNAAYQASIGNSFDFQPIGLKAEVQIGAAKLPAGNSLKWIGSLSLDQKITKYLSANMSAVEKPYYYTLSSLTTPVMQTEYSASLAWGKNYSNPTEKVKFSSFKNWNMKAAYGLQQFEDNNTIKNAYAWILTPPAGFTALKVRLGYAYSYTNANELRYASQKSVNNILANWLPDMKIAGIYNPYFTPRNQQIHSVIGQVAYTVSKSLSFGLKGSYAVYASAEAPYLYLSSPTTVAGGTSPLTYTPFDIKFTGNYQLSKQLTIEGGYTYTRAFFFDSQFVNLGFKYILKNGKTK